MPDKGGNILFGVIDAPRVWQTHLIIVYLPPIK